MKTIDEDFLTIEEESTDEERKFVLYVGKNRESEWVGERMSVTQNRKNGRVVFHAAFHGPIQIDEMQLILEGMLELSNVADQLAHTKEKTRAKK